MHAPEQEEDELTALFTAPPQAPAPEFLDFPESAFRAGVRSYEIPDHHDSFGPSPASSASISTHAIRRATGPSQLRIVGLGAGFITLGVVIGCIIAFATAHPTSAAPAPRPIEMAVAAPVLVTAPTIATIDPPAVTPASLPAPTRTIRIATQPAGATVELVVADGTTLPLGSTPLDAQLAPTRGTLVFTLADHVVRRVPFDTATDARVAIALLATK